jgi:hypothetical protein
MAMANPHKSWFYWPNHLRSFNCHVWLPQGILIPFQNLISRKYDIRKYNIISIYLTNYLSIYLSEIDIWRFCLAALSDDPSSFPSTPGPRDVCIIFAWTSHQLPQTQVLAPHFCLGLVRWGSRYVLLCVYIYIMCVYSFKHIHIYIYVHIYISTYIYTHTYICLHRHVFIYIYTYFYIYSCTYIHIFIFFNKYIHIYISRHTTVYTCHRR